MFPATTDLLRGCRVEVSIKDCHGENMKIWNFQNPCVFVSSMLITLTWSHRSFKVLDCYEDQWIKVYLSLPRPPLLRRAACGRRQEQSQPAVIHSIHHTPSWQQPLSPTILVSLRSFSLPSSRDRSSKICKKPRDFKVYAGNKGGPPHLRYMNM